MKTAWKLWPEIDRNARLFWLAIFCAVFSLWYFEIFKLENYRTGNYIAITGTVVETEKGDPTRVTYKIANNVYEATLPHCGQCAKGSKIPIYAKWDALQFVTLVEPKADLPKYFQGLGLAILFSALSSTMMTIGIFVYRGSWSVYRGRKIHL